jgi:hypothetical protein
MIISKILFSNAVPSAPTYSEVRLYPLRINELPTKYFKRGLGKRFLECNSCENYFS